MARSNASAHQTGQQGQANWPQEVDAYGRPIEANGVRGGNLPAAPYAPPSQPHAAGYPGDPHAGYGYQGQPGYAGPGYGQPVDPAAYHQSDYQSAPPQGGHDAYGQPQLHPAQGYQQPYQPVHGHGGAPVGHYPQSAAQPVAPSHFERFNPQAPLPANGYDRYDTQLSHDPQGHDAHAFDQRRYEQPAANHGAYGQPHYAQHDPAAHLQQGQQQSDPRSWDFGQYPPSGAPIGHAPQTGYDLDPHAGQHEPRFADPALQAHGWNMPAQAGHYQPHQQAPYPGQGYEPAGPQHAQYGTHAGDPALGYEHPHGSQEAGPDEEEEEAPRRAPRPMIVAAALVCAIAVGGGLAFGYKKLVADGSKSATPIVKADRSPVREKPKDPGGKEQPHTDKKFPNRLDEKSPPPAAAVPATPPVAPAETEGGPRRVTTVIINKDGTITPTAPPAPAGPPPGMVVENVPRPELRGPAPPERVVAPPVAPVQKAPPAQPRVADLPLPKVKAEPKAEAPQVVPPPARKKPAVRDDLLAQQPATGAPPVAAVPVAKSPAGSAGYVAVLVSRRSRDDALKSFEELGQKYPDVLKGRASEVRERDFGDAPTGPKGVWYRLIVGPPGSKEASQELCQRLAAQGFKGCFSMVY